MAAAPCLRLAALVPLVLSVLSATPFAGADDGRVAAPAPSLAAERADLVLRHFAKLGFKARFGAVETVILVSARFQYVELRS